MSLTGVKIEKGLVSLPPNSDATLVLAHGGAGPQDPQGDKYQVAKAKIERLVAQVPGLPPEDLPPSLIKLWESQSITARQVLSVGRALENEPLFNAGLGASLQSDGMARLSASMMESLREKFSAVINVSDFIHPLDLALKLQDETFCILDAYGANHLIQNLGLKRSSAVTGERIKSWIKHRRQTLADGLSTGRTGTIGAVAVSGRSQLAAVTSTGGVGNETPGRVGDSPTVAGNYCTSQVAISCTGIGEQIIALAVGPRLAFHFASGLSLADSMEATLTEAQKRDFTFATIAVAKRDASSPAEWVAGSVNCQMVWASHTAHRP